MKEAVHLLDRVVRPSLRLSLRRYIDIFRLSGLILLYKVYVGCDTTPMPKRSISSTLRDAIAKSDETLYAIAKGSGIDKAALGRFVKRRCSLSLLTAERVAEYLGMELVYRRRR